MNRSNNSQLVADGLWLGELIGFATLGSEAREALLKLLETR